MRNRLKGLRTIHARLPDVPVSISGEQSRAVQR
jgi:hypothetical protein